MNTDKADRLNVIKWFILCFHVIQFSYLWVVIEFLCYTYIYVFLLSSTERTRIIDSISTYYYHYYYYYYLEPYEFVSYCAITHLFSSLPWKTTLWITALWGNSTQVRGQVLKNRAARDSKTAIRQLWAALEQPPATMKTICRKCATAFLNRPPAQPPTAAMERHLYPGT